MWYVRDVLYAVLYVRASCFVVDVLSRGGIKKICNIVICLVLLMCTLTI